MSVMVKIRRNRRAKVKRLKMLLRPHARHNNRQSQATEPIDEQATDSLATNPSTTGLSGAAEQAANAEIEQTLGTVLTLTPPFVDAQDIAPQAIAPQAIDPQTIEPQDDAEKAGVNQPPEEQTRLNRSPDEQFAINEQSATNESSGGDLLAATQGVVDTAAKSDGVDSLMPGSSFASETGSGRLPDKVCLDVSSATVYQTAVGMPEISVSKVPSLDTRLQDVPVRPRRRFRRRMRRLNFRRVLRYFFRRYFNSFWMPGFVSVSALVGAIATLALSVNVELLGIYTSVVFAIGVAALVGAFVAFCGLLSATIWNMASRRWLKGLTNFTLLLFLCGGLTAATGSLLVFAMAHDYEPPIAKPVPVVADAASPIHRERATPNPDDYQKALLTALDSPEQEAATVTAAIDSLQYLQTNDPELLQRYLAMSPAWRVFEERGHRYATRRWRIGDRWQYNVHGYYDSSDIGLPTEDAYFQSRFTLGLSGEPWATVQDDATQVRPSETKVLTLSEGNLSTKQSNLVIEGDNLIVEIFEESVADARPLTQAALAFTEDELSDFTRYRDLAMIWATIPSDAVQQGTPYFQLLSSFEPGVYDAEIWANTGEPGMVYLKAYDLAKDRSIGSRRIKEKTSEWLGWSENPKELFLSNTHFTIHEGNWNQPYPARFEVWFVPDAGGAERKLMEKIYTVEGWQR